MSTDNDEFAELKFRERAERLLCLAADALVRAANEPDPISRLTLVSIAQLYERVASQLNVEAAAKDVAREKP
jgi:hypothetical protein